VEDSRRIDPILVPARPGAASTRARHRPSGMVRSEPHRRLGPAPSLAPARACR